MAGVMASVATGVMNSVIDKLTTLLGDREYRLISDDVMRGIRYMRDELSSMHAALQRLSEMDDDQIDVQTREWRSKVRELSYDIEDCVDRFIHLRSSNKAKANFVQSMVRKIKSLWENRQITKEIQELKIRVVEEKERRDRYNVDQYLLVNAQPVPLDPRAPTLYAEARDLIGIDGPREEIIGLLRSEERQLKVVSIYGIGGQGKTTLAVEVYRKIEEPFDCRALVSVSRTPDIRKLLKDILFQISKTIYDRSHMWEMEQLIPTLRDHLNGKRYLIVIDDIWSTAAWEHLQSALPDHNNRSRIITTTRSKAIARSCCTDIDGHIYQAKPLSEDNSHRLFFRRIFSPSEDCPQDLRAVASDILRKCSGLPLAIISIASLLANKSATVEVWNRILNSIYSAVQKDSPIDKMKRILFLSYFDLPHYLKSCLLYLSVFPEDYSIDCRRLIWIWVAEGLIPGRNRKSMEQQAESYLNELINRSMIQSTKIGVDGTTVKICRVHDLVLDFIVSQALEENFITIWNGKDSFENYAVKFRRLSIQTDNIQAEDVGKAVQNISHLRSINIFGSNLELGKHAGVLLNGQVLRVLNIQSSRNVQACHVGCIESFSQLKYLRITGYICVIKLPEEIGKLQHLETLDVAGNSIRELPESICQLQKLVRLFVPWEVQLPNEIQNLQALEELSCINLRSASARAIHGLGDLTKLRLLKIFWSTYDGPLRDDVEGHKKLCISSLSKLLITSLRTLNAASTDSDFILATINSYGSSPPLRRLRLSCELSTLPSQISSLVNLTRLGITVRGEVSKEGLTILASLPMLLSLTIGLAFHSDVVHPRHVISRQGFQRLVKFNFGGYHEAALVFEPGAMPKLQRLKLTLKARCQFKYGQGGLVLGLQNLADLKHMTVSIACDAAVAAEVEGLDDDIRGEAGAHPNRPTLLVKREYESMK